MVPGSANHRLKVHQVAPGSSAVKLRECGDWQSLVAYVLLMGQLDVRALSLDQHQFPSSITIAGSEVRISVRSAMVVIGPLSRGHHYFLEAHPGILIFP